MFEQNSCSTRGSGAPVGAGACVPVDAGLCGDLQGDLSVQLLIQEPNT